MNIFAKLKQDRREAKERELTRQAHQRIGVRDFEGSLYIAYDGTPLVPVKDEWTPKDIVLSDVSGQFRPGDEAHMGTPLQHVRHAPGHLGRLLPVALRPPPGDGETAGYFRVRRLRRPGFRIPRRETAGRLLPPGENPFP